jgi:cell wall assembly regulator SMI1
MSEHNGGEGWVGDGGYLILWKLDQLASLNAAYETQTYAPGLLIFGSSGGGDAYAFDLRLSPTMYVEVPFVGMDLEMVEPVADSFDGFLAAIAAYGFDNA